MKGQTVLLDSLVKTVEHGEVFTTTSFMLNGEPGPKAIVAATAAAYPVPEDLDSRLHTAAIMRDKVTLLLARSNAFGASSIVALEVSLVPAGKDGPNDASAIAFLPKGARKKGFRLPLDEVLDMVNGYGGASVLAKRVAAAKPAIEVETLTVEHLKTLPDTSQSETGERADKVGLAVYGLKGGAPAVWFLTEYDPENDIADGVLILHPSVGESEHGSEYGKDLIRFGGKVVGTVNLTFAEALALTDKDVEQALQAVAA